MPHLSFNRMFRVAVLGSLLSVALFVGADCACVDVSINGYGFCGGGGGGPSGPPPGGGGGPTATPTAPPVPTPTFAALTYKLRVGEYSYNGNSANCLGVANAVDPISIVVQSATTAVASHLVHHGLGTTDGVGNQYFLDYTAAGFVCQANAIGQASSGSGDRWHARGNTQDLLPDPYLGGYLTALTPHYDKAHGDYIPWYGCSPNDHIVQEDFYNNGSNISGFRVARDKIATDWIFSGQHAAIAVYNFNNIQLLEQCNGEFPQSDGSVIHLQ